MPKDKVYIIGVAPEGASSLSPEARRLVEKAELIFGGGRLLDIFPNHPAKKIVIKNNLAQIAGLIKQNLGQKRMVVLASGDPNFFGIASYLTDKLGKDTLEIIPNVSAMQLAFARIKEKWDDGVFVSVHSRPIEDVVGVVASNNKIGIFTDNKNTPAAIAKVLLKHGLDGYQAYLCQNLGDREEKVLKTDLKSLTRLKPSPLNVLILVREKPRPRQTFGIPEENFYRRRDGLITKQEVRAISLAKMELAEDSLVWDIGAGSGAVSIEASFLAKKGRVWAIEKNQNDIALIKKNLKKFSVTNVEAVCAFAPDGLEHLPQPDAVFIGGSGGRLEKIIDYVCQRLKPGGRIVINIATLENLSTATHSLKAKGFIPETIQVSIARSSNIAQLTRLEPLNMVFIVSATKKRE